MAYLLDTDICISLLKQQHGIKEKVRSVGIANCAISEITLLELRFGAEKSQRRSQHLAEVAQMGQLFQVLLISPCFPFFAPEKVRLQRAGQLIPDFDLLIGTTALAHQLTLVTNNLKHLGRIAGLTMENWRDPTDNAFCR